MTLYLTENWVVWDWCFVVCWQVESWRLTQLLLDLWWWGEPWHLAPHSRTNIIRRPVFTVFSLTQRLRAWEADILHNLEEYCLMQPGPLSLDEDNQGFVFIDWYHGVDMIALLCHTDPGFHAREREGWLPWAQSTERTLCHKELAKWAKGTKYPLLSGIRELGSPETWSSRWSGEHWDILHNLESNNLLAQICLIVHCFNGYDGISILPARLHRKGI